MFPSRSRPIALATVITVVSLVASACGASSTPVPSAAAPSATAAAPASQAAASPSLLAVTPAPVDNSGGLTSDGRVIVTWFIGLGTGGQPQQIASEQAVAAAFNALPNNKVYLNVAIYDNKIAPQILRTQIAAGNAPDIIGPVGLAGLNGFRDQMLDLTNLIAKHNFDLTRLDPKIVDFWKHQGTGTEMIGIPYATYPSFMYVNADLFKEAGLPLPPTKVGELYQGKPWDMDAVRQLGMKLTVDSKGNDATSPNFDPNNVVQWGFDMQYTDSSIVAESTLFGASDVVADDFKTAQIPPQLATGVKWYYDGVWKDHFIPSNTQINSDLLDKGNEFESGNLAMDESHSWFTCCIYPAAPAKPKVKDFAFAVAPSYNGTTTAKLHADTFALLKTTKHPDEAFTALQYLAASSDLLTTYGAFPADPSKQAAFTASIDKNFPGVKLDWTIPEAMLSFPDIPNHQADLPNYAKAIAALQAFQSKYRTTPGLDVDAELATLKTTLQGIFDSAGTP
jgi:multiple sugar transport system substrate-binding protein